MRVFFYTFFLSFLESNPTYFPIKKIKKKKEGVTEQLRVFELKKIKKNKKNKKIKTKREFAKRKRKSLTNILSQEANSSTNSLIGNFYVSHSPWVISNRQTPLNP